MTTYTPLIQHAVESWKKRSGGILPDLRAALIDMDGTLYDSMRNHTASWYRLMTGLGVDCTRDEFYLYEGCTGADTIRRLWRRQFATEPDEGFIKELYHRKTQYFNELPRAGVMPGARRMIAALREAGIDTVLVTGSGQPSVLGRLDADFPDAFPEYKRVTARNVTHGKPDPEPYLLGMKLAGVKPRQAMVVENAPVGVLAGVRSGAFTAAVTTGPIPRCEFERAGADIIVGSMEEFADMLPALIDALKNNSNTQ